MDVETLLDRVRARYDGLVTHETWGEHGLFYNPGRDLPRGTYVLTVKTHNSDHDRASNLDRPDVYRVSVGVSTDTYRDRFGALPARPPKGVVVDTGHDVSRTDVLLPHPVYAWAGWVCVNSPTAETLETLWPLADEAYDRARTRYDARLTAAN